MKLAQCVEAYVARKRASGFVYTASGKILWRFARFVGNVDISEITERDLDLFLTRNAISNNTWRRYVCYLGKFFTYWFARQQLKRIPIAKSKPAIKTAFFPFVYSRAEIRRLLDATGPCQRFARCSLDALTMRTILLLIYGTGIRVSDALTILDSDIDFKCKTIHVQSGNVRLSRKIPISSDVTYLLREYLARPRRAEFGPGKPVFLTSKGKSVPYAVVGHAFQQIRRCARVTRQNSSYQPRIHDLRHTFAVHSIASWETAGLSIEKMLPILVAYMGNLSIEGGERYLELSPSSFRAQLDCLRANAGAKQDLQTLLR
jgi:integrase/recombinase XerD